ncbi:MULTISPECIES: sensor histidine kinase [Levilactobacillus]|uniref:sensor histidine kinase n=1 Tax=Levilactobacillus TaxID=2767886 RepID=UPI001950D9BB|nr:sensor histidine kinase [Levilactobacillus sp. 244-2]
MMKQFHLYRQERYQRIILAAICIALASQVNFQTYAPGFIITLSVFILPVILYFNSDLNPIQLLVAVTIASPIFRGLLLFIGHAVDPYDNVIYILADMAFYMCYGILYYFLYWRKTERTNTTFFLTIVLCDYLSNLLEVSLLTDFSHYTYRLFQILFIAALVRSIVSCLLAFLYHYFKLMLRDEKHEQRYYHFIWVASAVNSEVYFMRKNISEIENVMKNAYLLNQDLQHTDVDKAEQDKALQIARDVHEIKKDYQNVIRGLGDYFNDDEDTAMQLSDILTITTSYIRESIKAKFPHVTIDVHNHVDLVIPNHYYVVSILSNLIFNSVDAMENQPSGTVVVSAIDRGNHIILNVSDNASGMDQETLSMIFQPGFTTKFNENGDVYRGIGLSHVKIIAQEQFDGDINVTSELGKGTNFEVTLSKKRLEQEEEA